MKVVETYPPNYTEISRKFPNLEKHKPIFCYGDTIHNPFGATVTHDLIAHESTHKEQQGDDIKGWWSRYLKDDKFRLDQETKAYARQFAFIRDHYRGASEEFLDFASKSLSGELYGNMLNENQARIKIRREVKKVNIK